MVLSTQQKIIIRQIAQKQIRSFTKIAKYDFYKELLHEFEEEGFDVTDVEILEQITKEIELWDVLLDEPERFISRLDELNLDMLKHILFQEFELNPETRGIWKKLNVFDKFDLGNSIKNIN